MEISKLAPESIEAAKGKSVILRVGNVTVGFGEKLILENLNLNIYKGEVLGFVGGSGTGKSVLMRTILNLTPMQSGSIEVFGIDTSDCSDEERERVNVRMGVLFQQGALFSSLTVLQNVQVPMREHYDLGQSLMDELAYLKLEMVGLPMDAAQKYPSELSGGMVKRASLARALALDPKLVFLDEPTSGLDPIGAAEFDALILSLRETLNLTVYMVTHDLDSLHKICDRIAVLRNKQVLIAGSMQDILDFEDPWVQSYFKGERSLSRM